MKKSITVNVMAPLLVGNPKDLDSAESRTAWAGFARQLQEIMQYGAQAVSTDVWWGLIQPQENSFDWRYYDRVAEYVVAAGLKWVPILSLHQCGGNIGDGPNTVMLPDWVWNRLSRLCGGDANAAKYVSEQGNVCSEYVSVWATDLVLDCYIAVMKAFQEHYADKANHIAEINISLGPAGELRYPSYNSHDDGADYPRRGSLQAYSKLARQSFNDYIMRKYGDRDGLNRAWGQPLDASGHVIEPPRDVTHFVGHGGQFKTQYGRDFFDWYADSLLEHGRKVLHAAFSVFAAEDAAFAGIDIAAKVPGVHWRVGSWKGNAVEFGDRLAELAAGLIRTSCNDWRESEGWGYRSLVSMFNEFSKAAFSNRMVLHFTCLEMPDGDGGTQVNSLAYSLVRWVGNEARRLGLPIKGENALGFKLYVRESWDRMRSHLDIAGNDGAYEGITFLRMSDILGSVTGRNEMARLTAQLATRKVA